MKYITHSRCKKQFFGWFLWFYVSWCKFVAFLCFLCHELMKKLCEPSLWFIIEWKLMSLCIFSFDKIQNFMNFILLWHQIISNIYKIFYGKVLQSYPIKWASVISYRILRKHIIVIDFSQNIFVTTFNSSGGMKRIMNEMKSETRQSTVFEKSDSYCRDGIKPGSYLNDWQRKNFSRFQEMFNFKPKKNFDAQKFHFFLIFSVHLIIIVSTVKLRFRLAHFRSEYTFFSSEWVNEKYAEEEKVVWKTLRKREKKNIFFAPAIFPFFHYVWGCHNGKRNLD